MSRPPSTAIAAAIELIRHGVPWRKAAAFHRVTMSGISKALKREASRCPTCGQVVKENKHVAED